MCESACWGGLMYGLPNVGNPHSQNSDVHAYEYKFGRSYLDTLATLCWDPLIRKKHHVLTGTPLLQDQIDQNNDCLNMTHIW